MKRSVRLNVCLVCLLLGCRGARDKTTPIDTPSDAVELSLLCDPPVSAKCELTALPEYRKHRSYLAYDLNADGLPEYFVQDWVGANSMGFALVDSNGRLLTGTTHVGEIGGDRLLILTSRHHGYHDILASDSDASSMREDTWEFNGKCYVRTREFEYEGADRRKAYIEKVPGAVVGCWYFDMFGRPPPELPDNGTNADK